jgi:hypothetical protein
MLCAAVAGVEEEGEVSEESLEERDGVVEVKVRTEARV